MKQVIKLIEQHCHKTHTDRHNGLEALLDYMIEFFDIKPFMENRYEEYGLKAKHFMTSFKTFDMYNLHIKWVEAMYRLEPELTKIRYTEEEMHSLNEGVKVLSYTWGDPVNLFGSAIDATNDYADTFPTLAEKMNYKKVEEETMKNL